MLTVLVPISCRIILELIFNNECRREAYTIRPLPSIYRGRMRVRAHWLPVAADELLNIQERAFESEIILQRWVNVSDVTTSS